MREPAPVVGVLVVIALGLALVVSICWALARRFHRYRFGLVDGEPKCGRCGYIVHPGSRPICPECGSELLKVGVYTPATAPPIFPWPLSVVVYIFLAMAAFWAGPAIARLTPWKWDLRAWRSIDTPVARPTALSREGTFGIMATGTAWWWGTRIEEIGVEYITPDRQNGLIEPLARTSFYGGEYFGPDDKYLDDDRAKVRDLVRAAGFDPAAEDGARLADQVMSAIRQFRRHEWPAPAPNAGLRYRAAYTSGFVEGILFWIIAAVLAGRVIDRWHWRRREHALERKHQLLRDLGLAT